MIFIAGWTGKAPAQFHKLNDASSNLAPATIFVLRAAELLGVATSLARRKSVRFKSEAVHQFCCALAKLVRHRSLTPALPGSSPGRASILRYI